MLMPRGILEVTHKLSVFMILALLVENNLMEFHGVLWDIPCNVHGQDPWGYFTEVNNPGADE